MCERVEGAQGLATVINALGLGGPDELSDTELHQLVIDLERESSRLAAVRARYLGAWDRRRSWADDGSRSASARLARDADLSPPTQGIALRRARKPGAT